ncbi:CopG family ribbon-helix-helix protein [Sphingomonas sanxanigenens]|uniref:CopG family ribbon-helix-helix protein n=1 Tax=Sphingomonas sanxanigenens TaxID=397260 RepID=UPI001FDF2FCE|nr:CopG family ribbon-helix-helix protein [Sphingomonas sanxanigenens]
MTIPDAVAAEQSRLLAEGLGPDHACRGTKAANCVTLYTSDSKERDVGASTTMTIRVTPDLKEKLGRLAQNTRRTKSYLAAEAVEAYVNRELQIIEGIQRGLVDSEAGRVTPHKDAMDRIDAAIAAASAKAR